MQNESLDTRRNNFDFLRLFLALLVVVTHSFTVMGRESEEPINRLSQCQDSFGSVAVGGFFVISGFLITQSWCRSRTAWAYFRKRILRIYPAFIAATLFLAFVICPLGADREARVFAPIQFAKIVAHSVTLAPYVCRHVFTIAHNGTRMPQYAQLDSPMWTIAYEFMCYIGVALLAWVGILRRRGLVLVILAGAIVLAFCFRRYPEEATRPQWLHWLTLIDHHWPAQLGIFNRWPRLAAFFLAGGAYYLYREELPLKILPALLCFISLLLGACWPEVWAVILPTFGTYFILWFALNPRIPLHAFAKHGDFSYGAYLYAWPVQQLAVLWFGTAFSPWLLVACVIPLSVLAGWCSWHLVEKRFIRLKNKPPLTNPASVAEPAGVLQPIHPRNP